MLKNILSNKINFKDSVGVLYCVAKTTVPNAVLVDETAVAEVVLNSNNNP